MVIPHSIDKEMAYLFHKKNFKIEVKIGSFSDKRCSANICALNVLLKTFLPNNFLPNNL